MSALVKQLPFTLNCEVSRAMMPFFAQDPGIRYRVTHGGRGSIKSWTLARVLLLMGCQRKMLIVCAREYQKSIRESVHRLLNRQIQRMHLAGEYDVKDSRIVNRWTGTEFIFVGLHHNIESIKSMEGIDIVWVEEAETVSAESWAALDPTVREKGSEIWVSFNPKEETDPTWQRFIVDPMPGTVVCPVSWKDNHWLPDVLRIQAEWMREHDPEGYAHIWEGKLWFKNDAQVLHDKWCVKDFDIRPEWINPDIPLEDGTVWTGPYFGDDWGFSMDPTAVAKSYIHVLNAEDIGRTMPNGNGEDVPVPLHRDLYIREEAFALGCETLDLPALFDQVSESRKYQHVADCARPETISHMVNQGFNIVGCTKWENCAKDGVAYLRGFDHIYIHPECTNMYEEARLWSFKVDRLTGKPLPELKPGHDHGWDAVRYSHEELITRNLSMWEQLERQQKRSAAASA